jgi:hypothetical protein
MNGAKRLEERTPRWHDTFGLVVDGKAQLPLYDVSEDEARMTVWPALTGLEVSFDQHDVEPFERPRQRVSCQFSVRLPRGGLCVDADGQ